jgi:hypothetical protein
MDLTSYQNYLLYNIANAQIRSWPWTHVVFDKIIHPDQYTQILNNLPASELLADIRKISFHLDDYSETRFILPADAYTDFWLGIKNQFLDGRLKQLVLNKFLIQLQTRFGSLLSLIEFYDTFQLTLDKPGYSLRPHTDVDTKIFTIVINLPATDENLNQGTVIYTGPTDKHILYQSAYAPNTGFGIFRSNNSWHGVEPVTADRWTIQYTVWGKDKE